MTRLHIARPHDNLYSLAVFGTPYATSKDTKKHGKLHTSSDSMKVEIIYFDHSVMLKRAFRGDYLLCATPQRVNYEQKVERGIEFAAERRETRMTVASESRTWLCWESILTSSSTTLVHSGAWMPSGRYRIPLQGTAIASSPAQQ
ncbi:uncharacterized protein ARMOST_17671 [Armillaria ostoyae]|uniref:Uncharacterized protein n=1 Tax=Armillaria ostoyae TaxID=47428 RepID=A0A284RZL8_ARMOS|nr:uncharacterized protein ARMOST_17671 [Armillaria ostoyae]